MEVLSPSTGASTREKLFAYRLLPSLCEYLLLRQDRVQADLYQLNDEGSLAAQGIHPQMTRCCAAWMLRVTPQRMPILPELLSPRLTGLAR